MNTSYEIIYVILMFFPFLDKHKIKGWKILFCFAYFIYNIFYAEKYSILFYDKNNLNIEFEINPCDYIEMLRIFYPKIKYKLKRSEILFDPKEELFIKAKEMVKKWVDQNIKKISFSIKKENLKQMCYSLSHNLDTQILLS
jgi:hypothetical protein